MDKSIELSLAIVTRDRPDSLARCLGSIRASLPAPMEVLVSDDSDASFAGQNQRISAEFQARYQPGPKRGLYANRNQAAIACTGTHIRTIDDDQTFPSGHFQQCLAAVEHDPKAVWTTGEITYIDERRAGAVETANQLHPSGVGGPVANRDDNWAIADGSTIYPRVIFDRGLRMMEAFSYGSSYLEFGAYLYQHGYRGRCLPGVCVEHHPDRPALSRKDDLRVVQSRLFASLCYNLYFRPNRVLALKYLAVYLFRGWTRKGLFSSLPGLLELARKRWQF